MPRARCRPGPPPLPAPTGRAHRAARSPRFPGALRHLLTAGGREPAPPARTLRPHRAAAAAPPGRGASWRGALRRCPSPSVLGNRGARAGGAGRNGFSTADSYRRYGPAPLPPGPRARYGTAPLPAPLPGWPRRSPPVSGPRPPGVRPQGFCPTGCRLRWGAAPHRLWITAAGNSGCGAAGRAGLCPPLPAAVRSVVLRGCGGGSGSAWRPGLGVGGRSARVPLPAPTPSPCSAPGRLSLSPGWRKDPRNLHARDRFVSRGTRGDSEAQELLAKCRWLYPEGSGHRGEFSLRTERGPSAASRRVLPVITSINVDPRLKDKSICINHLPAEQRPTLAAFPGKRSSLQPFG